MSTLEITIDAIDRLITAGVDDREITAALTKCRQTLAAISWERFRLRHEELNRRAAVAKRHGLFACRHKIRR